MLKTAMFDSKFLVWLIKNGEMAAIQIVQHLQELHQLVRKILSKQRCQEFSATFSLSNFAGDILLVA